MEVVSAKHKGTSIFIVCEGDFGFGTQGLPSVGKIVCAIENAVAQADVFGASLELSEVQ